MQVILLECLLLSVVIIQCLPWVASAAHLSPTIPNSLGLYHSSVLHIFIQPSPPLPPTSICLSSPLHHPLSLVSISSHLASFPPSSTPSPFHKPAELVLPHLPLFSCLTPTFTLTPLSPLPPSFSLPLPPAFSLIAHPLASP